MDKGCREEEKIGNRTWQRGEGKVKGGEDCTGGRPSKLLEADDDDNDDCIISYFYTNYILQVE